MGRCGGLKRANKGISLEGHVGESTVTFRPGVYLTEVTADQHGPHSTYLAEGGRERLSLTREDLRGEKLRESSFNIKTTHPRNKE